jgi:hypothetical protein
LDITSQPNVAATRAAVDIATTDAPKRLSTEVAHLHRVGNCRGQLIVSREGVEFVPDDKTGKDGFTLHYTEFLHALAENTLTIKSNNRTYRFRALTENGKEDEGAQLRMVVNSIVRFR